MSVTLDQAIEIHAKALKHQFGSRASRLAQEKAHNCAAQGNDEGHIVWLRVSIVAERLPELRSHRLSVDGRR